MQVGPFLERKYKNGIIWKSNNRLYYNAYFKNPQNWLDRNKLLCDSTRRYTVSRRIGDISPSLWTSIISLAKLGGIYLLLLVIFVGLFWIFLFAIFRRLKCQPKTTGASLTGRHLAAVAGHWPTGMSTIKPPPTWLIYCRPQETYRYVKKGQSCDISCN
jgi:hypothetical protein